jgi:hypothetical protein
MWGLADPARLQPTESSDKQALRVVMETPKGSRNKFAFDPEEHIFELEGFFVNYHELSGKKYRVLGGKSPDKARSS